jgi:hypothetical protein
MDWRRAALILACVPAVAEAHTFGRLYTLPVPFWLYAWGVTAALVISFLAAGYFMVARPLQARGRAIPLGGSRAFATLQRLRASQVLQVASVAALLLTIATGFFGSREPLRNFSMTAFWILFLLGLTYATVLVGNAYAVLNPWRVLVVAVERMVPGFGRGRRTYPAALDVWPALALFVALIWFELAFRGTPFSLAVVLTGYTLLNFAGAWLVGATAWFRHCEVFAVFFRHVALLAPLACEPGAKGGAGTLTLRWPGTAVLHERPAHVAGVLFVLAMLAATAYDGLRETRPWFALFWHDPFGVITPWLGERPIDGFVAARPWYRLWDTAWLVAAPFAYFAAYAVTVALARALTRTRRPFRELLLDFAYTLLPIVLAYHAAHYFTLLLDQGPKILSLASDPFGYGWDLFGTAQSFRAAYIPDLTWVWHVQVLLILAGHVASVLLAHRVALRVFASRRAAVWSQLPMLLLMVGLTIGGLWILSQPLTSTMIVG